MENIKEGYEELAQWSFDSKETYLAWVAEWKWFYVSLSRHIRESRMNIRESQRNGSDPTWRLIYSLNTARHYATCALLLRANCKKEAAFQSMIVREARQKAEAS